MPEAGNRVQTSVADSSAGKLLFLLSLLLASVFSNKRHRERVSPRGGTKERLARRGKPVALFQLGSKAPNLGPSHPTRGRQRRGAARQKLAQLFGDENTRSRARLPRRNRCFPCSSAASERCVPTVKGARSKAMTLSSPRLSRRSRRHLCAYWCYEMRSIGEGTRTTFHAATRWCGPIHGPRCPRAPWPEGKGLRGYFRPVAARSSATGDA